ncbi:hypothetical protein HOT48_gp009 [Klebsiella phage ZCKP1]|uniref:Uncharacterized protein n=1 Tax=Klebsiella phage ZCKP1 TaxID=2201417 RepID=A0A2Z4QDL7_9CAUD|nr:hypothetical protein HOT48_gp009 [Klebsiella phage ZCKP1]AWY08024.1 hypothetical protein [Klebsiella phage ZCKP1]
MLNKIEEGCMAFLVDNPFPFMVKIHVGEYLGNDEWDCSINSEMHHYQPTILKMDQMARITVEDELIIELYERALHK